MRGLFALSKVIKLWQVAARGNRKSLVLELRFPIIDGFTGYPGDRYHWSRGRSLGAYS